jgi:tRNA 2-thiocytidine biosynthesis protein TtcA
MEKLKKNDLDLFRKLGRAILDYNLIEDNERVLIAVSGGKDSVTLLDLLRKNLIYRVLPINYELNVFHLSITENDQYQIIESYCKEYNIPFYHKNSNLLQIVMKEKRNPCYLCSQIRRKWIFDIADNLKIKKIALGHTKDDIVTTSLMNIFYHRICASQLVKLPILNDKFVIIRPLAYIDEKEIIRYKERYRLPVFKQHCTIGDNKRRKFVQNLINKLEKDIPQIKDNIFAAFRNPSYNFFLDRYFAPIDYKGKKYRP